VIRGLTDLVTKRLSPYMSSIDGNEPLAAFNNQWIPFTTQSPIAIYITILTTAYFQATTRGISGDKSVEVIGTKVKLITLINEHIVSHSGGVNDDSIAAVMSLTFNEVRKTKGKESDKLADPYTVDIRRPEKHPSTYAGTSRHDKNQRRDPKHHIWFTSNDAFEVGVLSLLTQNLSHTPPRTDFQIACTYECDLFLHEEEPISVLTSYPLQLDSPLLLSPHHFGSSLSLHGISAPTAMILDDIRFLSSSVISLSQSPYDEESHAKFLATAHWIHSRLTAPPDPALASDYVHQSVLVVAIIYSSAILTRTPLSLACTPQLLRQLWGTLWHVTLPRWKQLPGIFFWILLVVNPYTRDKPEGRFLKGLMPATTIGIGMVKLEVMTGILRSCLAVQKWLGGDLRGLGITKSVKVVHGIPEGGLPGWSMSE